MKQTYENRELLIVADSLEDAVGLVPHDERIRTILRSGVVGIKRNAGCDYAEGSVIAVWDDDDYSAPGRLVAQIHQLGETGKAVTGYSQMKFTDGSNWWQYRGNVSALGTSLCFTKDWWEKHKFLEVQCGQDELFASAALREGQLVREGDVGLMYATVHHGNTSPRATANRSSYYPLPGFEWRDAA